MKNYRITYFKLTGKFYQQVQHNMPDQHFFKNLRQLKENFAAHIRPGMVDGPPEQYLILVEEVTHNSDGKVQLLTPWSWHEGEKHGG